MNLIHSDSKPIFGCVYKMGGDYTYVDVLRLKHNIERHTTMDFEFICLTDNPILLATSENDYGVEIYSDLNIHWALPLINNWKGWWSVIELFRLTGPVMVTGLDTVFVGPVDPFFELAMNTSEEDFYMIHAFKRKEVWASGFMVWNGDWSWLYKDFNFKRDSRHYKWEQRYTKQRLLNKGVPIKGVQDEIDGIYSFKHHCRKEGHPPTDARAILFHGHPRPSHCRDTWIRKEWN